MYVSSTDKKYTSANIALGKYILLEYEDWTVKENLLGCGNEDEEDDDEDEFDNEDDDETDEEIEFRGSCDGNTIRVLVLYTAAAAVIDAPVVVAKKIIDELNSTTRLSGLNYFDINFALANTVLLEGFVEDRESMSDDLDRLRNHTVAKQLRNDNLADVVILLTRPIYIDVAGIGYLKAKNAKAYCIAEITAAKTNFTGSHEIGHILKHTTEETIDISTHPKGVYWIKVRNSSTHIQKTFKIIYL